MRLFPAACILFVTVAAVSADDAFDRAVADLASDDPDVRESAERKLAKGGVDTTEAVRKALDASEDPEVRVRLRRVLDAFERAKERAEGPSTPEAWLRAVKAASDACDGTAFFALNCSSTRQEVESEATAELKSLKKQEAKSRDEGCREEFGVGYEEACTMTAAELAASLLSRTMGGEEQKAIFDGLDVESVEITGERAICHLNIPDEESRLPPVLELVREEKIWLFDRKATDQANGRPHDDGRGDEPAPEK